VIIVRNGQTNVDPEQTDIGANFGSPVNVILVIWIGTMSGNEIDREVQTETDAGVPRNTENGEPRRAPTKTAIVT
jgi:hypothetical protein